MISCSDRNSPMYRAYSVVIQQAQTNSEWNRIRHGHSDDLSKSLHFAKAMEGNA